MADLKLSAVETEQVRDVRSRLNRKAVSEAALNALGAAFLQTCGRVDIGASEPVAVTNLSGELVVKAAATADMKLLARLVATLAEHRQKTPKVWTALVAAGAPQAILSRRLVLAGREAPAEVAP
ncbi:hypothetical protein [Caulobacter mirabilis]|uniref:Uncharacterized protein n=1 Tax=Caulobacter mirabilis TaxID=69666 RepID=A0A2D2AW08_9CAUL|nr:hypothetical protein [Caulobacter mirabilis]ATQ42194.1 hypothetical protein CSW64_07080 [Caulobacter mirabilis]